MPRSNGSTGSTTAACCSRSATCRRPKPKRPTTGSWRSSPQSPLDSNETASEEVGTVHCVCILAGATRHEKSIRGVGYLAIPTKKPLRGGFIRCVHLPLGGGSLAVL